MGNRDTNNLPKIGILSLDFYHVVQNDFELAIFVFAFHTILIN